MSYLVWLKRPVSLLTLLVENDIDPSMTHESKAQSASESAAQGPKPVFLRVHPTQKVSTEQWSSIRSIMEAGGAAEQVAKRFGIQPSTIHKRGTKERWATPNRVRALAQRSEVITGDPASEVAALWKERETNAREMVYQGSQKALQRFFAMAPVPQSFSEAATAQKLLKEAITPPSDITGLINTNIQVLAMSGFAPRPVVDV